MAFGTPPFASHAGGQNDSSMMGVVGTLGTADTGGTAQILPMAVDPSTGAVYVNILAGAGAASNPTAGTLSTLGTVGTILGIGGTVTVTGASAGTNVNIVTGTQQTLGTVANLNNGSVILQSGTLTAGTLPVVTTVSNLTNGSVNLLTGTINAGTFVYTGGTLNSIGTISALQGGTVASGGTIVASPLVIGGTTSTNGTVFAMQVDQNGRLIVLPSGVGGTITNIGQLYNAGTVQNISAGTVSVVNNLVTGTLAAVTSVTNLAAGTVQMSPIPTIGQSTFGSHGTTGATVFGTLAGGTSSGAGTEIFVTSVSLSLPSTAGSQDVSIGWGTNGGTFHAGTGLIVRGNFPAGGGIAKSFTPAINSGTNAQLTVFQAGAGTIDVSVTYFVTASTL